MSRHFATLWQWYAHGGQRKDMAARTLHFTREKRGWIHDVNSFRVTWITLALAAGVPLERVQRVSGHRTVQVVMSDIPTAGRHPPCRVSGHRTVQVVMKHYFRPGGRLPTGSRESHAEDVG